ncbi:TPA: type IVB secretion system protein DotG/IcmE [Legionella anisa]|uniref:type IVB secretion system protein DotG/IcmE n=1 Tax=Legionella anisa TaxID=28082 RepID=UPI000348E00E|nr:type IVB secretion system protein DotG/IcmE [Legionella anisa]AWN75378.1 type IV secretion protein IcmE [Legionella anisa]MCW8424442.1 type IVB secretion system protein DotG/IcmE [Legionella anisa]MCW8446440.1 type IVB secretion system protein DotG/IcmE [Legionella anisa]
MAGRKENIKSLFSNTRTRVIIIFTIVLILIAIVVGYLKLRSINTGPSAVATVGQAPGGIQSIPGVLSPTAQYAKLQEEQNITQAQKAEQTGGSAIPTIIRTQALGEGVGVIGSQGGQTGVGFATLAREGEEGSQKSLWLQTLQNAGCSKTAVQQVISQGAQLADLRGACSCVQLKDNGFTLMELNPVCPCKELKAAGFNARQLKDAGYTASRLRECGFNACELRNAGFTAQEMKDAGFSDDELKGAGYTPEEIARASGLPAGITAADVRKAGCSVDALVKLRKAGVSASAIRRISGCSVEQLKAAGFTAKELRDAGFSAADLKRAGFTPEELRAAGFTARDLLNAGFTPDDLAKAGYSAADIKAAENELPPGITPDDVKKSGCDVDVLRKERLAGVSATLIKRYAGCSAQALKAAGFTDADLANAGFTPQQIGSASPLTDAQIKAAGCDPDNLKKLFAAGVPAKRIKELNGCSAEALKNAGYDAKSLLDAGYTPSQLLAAGFTPQELQNAGLSVASPLTDAQIKAADCNPDNLKKLFTAGVSAKRIKELNGCSAEALKNAGYNAQSLIDAGFTPSQLLAAGFTPQELQNAGLSPAEVIAAARVADCSVDALKKARAAGISALTIKKTLGCSAKALKDAGYTAKELKDAGFTAAELKAAGFSAKDLKDAGFSAKELKDAGFSAKELKDAGFSAKELKDAGFSAKDLKDAGFTAAQLKAAGFSAKDLKDAGFSAKELKDAGFSAKDLKDAGFSAKDLKDAGFSAKDLKDAGFSAKELKDAGFTAAEMKAAGFGAKELADAGFGAADLKNAGFSAAELQNIQTAPDGSQVAGLGAPSIQQGAFNLGGVPTLGQGPGAAAVPLPGSAESNQQLQSIINRQNQQQAEQKYQQKIQQKTSDMLTAANQLIAEWKNVPTQSYTAGSKEDEKAVAAGAGPGGPGGAAQSSTTTVSSTQVNMIRTGDVLFAVIDTSVNSDEPGPILASIVSGRLKGTKLIGSFNLPSNANKMVITFNTMSIPGAPKTIPISAYAIDPNTARTALSSKTNNHYLLRYGSLFASSFLEGFGNAFQSANTTVTIGGTGGGNNVTVANGVGRSTLENAVIGLATVGKTWGQQAQVLFNTPTTVEVYAGTPVGVLFTQDVKSI